MKFAVFILSHQRADRVETYYTLENSGVDMSKVYVVVDDEDTQLEIYQKRFSEHLIVFNKQSYIEITDTLETTKSKSSAVYARNFIENEARELGLDAFGMFDDDILNLRYRWIDGNVIRSKKVENKLDDVMQLYVEYMLASNLQTVSFGNVMTLIGGVKGLDKKLCNERYTFQIHIRNTKYPLEWKSLINNDTVSEIQQVKLGNIWLSIPWIVYDSPVMNTLSGGMKDVYDSLSDFRRAFFATVSEPSFCCPRASGNKIVIGRDNKQAYPMIISGRWKK